MFTRSHPILQGKVDQTDGIPYLGAGSWSVDIRPLDGEAMKTRPWIAKAVSVNHLYMVETLSGGFRATAKGFDGEVIDDYHRDWQR